MSQFVLFLKQNSIVVFWVAVFQNIATYSNHRYRFTLEILYVHTLKLFHSSKLVCDMNGIAETLNRYNNERKSLIQLSADICIFDKPQPLTFEPVKISKHRKQTEVKRKTQLGQKFCSGVRTCGDWTVSWQKAPASVEISARSTDPWYFMSPSNHH